MAELSAKVCAFVCQVSPSWLAGGSTLESSFLSQQSFRLRLYFVVSFVRQLIQGSNADHSLSEQGQSHIAAPLEVPHRVNTHLIALLPHSHKTTIGRPNLSTVEDIAPVVQSSPRSFTVPEAFNRYFRSFLQ